MQNNGVATALKAFAVAEIAASVLLFVLLWGNHAAAKMTAFMFLAGGLVSGLMLFGFAEIIALLAAIRWNTMKSEPQRVSDGSRDAAVLPNGIINNV